MTEGFNKVASILEQLPGMGRNSDFRTLEIGPDWQPSPPKTMEIGPDWTPSAPQPLPGLVDKLPGSGLTQERKYPWEGPFGGSPPFGGGRLPPRGMPTPGGSGGGWKMECTPVPSTPRRPEWGGPFNPAPGNI
jgi:hypothetical protein